MNEWVTGKSKILSGCYIFKCLWPAIDSVRTGWLLGLDKASLRSVIGFNTRPCEIRLLTGIWNRFLPNYSRVCCDEEELETIEHLLCNCPALGKLKLTTGASLRVWILCWEPTPRLAIDSLVFWAGWEHLFFVCSVEYLLFLFSLSYFLSFFKSPLLFLFFKDVVQWVNSIFG